MYRLYLDEVGTDGLTHLDKDRHRYLSLSGVAIHQDHVREHLTPMMNGLKASVFKHDPDAPIIFHRKKILGLKGPFQALRDDETREKFNKGILECFTQTEYKVITALIDKDWMLKQGHWSKTHPYHWLMELLVEKYTQFLERKNDMGDIMPEGRQGNPDLALQRAYASIRIWGTQYVNKQRIRSAIPAKSLKFRYKSDNSSGLQLCDLIAHPSHIFIRTKMRHQVTLGPFSSKVARILWDQKYDRSPYNGNVMGYGIKHFP